MSYRRRRRDGIVGGAANRCIRQRPQHQPDNLVKITLLHPGRPAVHLLQSRAGYGIDMVADRPTVDPGFSRIRILHQFVGPFVVPLHLGRQRYNQYRAIQPVVPGDDDNGAVLLKLRPQRIAPKTAPIDRSKFWCGCQPDPSGGGHWFIVSITDHRARNRRDTERQCFSTAEWGFGR